MLSWTAALLLLAAMGWLGAALLGRFAPYLDPLERRIYGPVAGIVAASLVLLLLASLLGLSLPLVVVVAIACAAGAAMLARGPRDRPQLLDPRGGLVVPVIVLGALILRWVVFWAGAVTTDAEGLWVAQASLWGDWAQHLGDVASFVYGDNFPPSQPRVSGEPFAYHYLTSITVAAMVKLGLTPAVALPLHSFLLSVLLAVGVYAFARRLTLDRTAAGLALLLFVLGGGLGWWVTVEEIYRSQEFGTLLEKPWDGALQAAGNFEWLNVFFALIAPQRAYLYGLPLGLLVLTLLREATRHGRRGAFLAAGLVAGLLPFAHLGTLLSLALVTPFLFLLFPGWGWVRFFGGWIVVAVPQLLLQQGGGPGALAALRFQPGWVAAPDLWPWFWLKNLGLFLPLLVVTFAVRLRLPSGALGFLAAFMPAFFIANLVVFQPWDWDNTKVLVTWFLAGCILVGTLLAHLWRELRAPAARLLVAIALVTMILSGLLQNLHQLLGKERNVLLTAEELELARQVREGSNPHALFAVGLQHNHPVPVMAGRKVVMSYPGWLWSQGMDYARRESDLRAIFALAPEAPELIARYGIDYVVVGPNEREHLGADPDEFRARYPAIFRTDTYEVFAVTSDASSRTRSESRTPPG